MPALLENDTLIDDRKLQDLIAYMQRYSKNLLFITPDPIDPDDDNKNPSWEEFFKNDILFLIANVATKNVNEIKEAYDRLYEIFEKEKTVENSSAIRGYERFIFPKSRTRVARCL